MDSVNKSRRMHIISPAVKVGVKVGGQELEKMDGRWEFGRKVLLSAGS